jgi:tetratricopeptide (TPR) repeat protein
LFFNMLFLWVFGTYVEEKVGAVRFILLYFACEIGTELVFSLLLGGDGIGASGAISGIMAIYLARFYHERIKTFYWFFIWPITYDIPVKFIIPFWFARDLAFGVMGMSDVTNVAYFAHVGGFLTGLIIAKAMRFDVEGRSEYFKLRAAKSLATREHTLKALKDLERAREENPDDPEVLLLLARYYHARSDGKLLAEKYYRLAIDLYYGRSRDAVSAAGVFLEMIRNCPNERPVPEHLKYARILAAAGDSASAAQILGQLLGRPDLNNAMGKKALIHLVRCASEVEDRQLLIRGLSRLEELFPGSAEAKRAARDLARKQVDPLDGLPTAMELVGKERWSFLAWLSEMMSQRFYWFLWTWCFLFLALAVTIAYADELGIYVVLLALAVPTLFAAGLVHLHLESGSAASWFLFGTGRRKTQLQAQRDFNISNYFNRGMAAERDEEWLGAVKYYKGVLEEDPNHIEARFNLARIYHRQLQRKGSAIHEYEKLMETLPETAPYHMTAREAVEELQGKRPAPEPIKPLEWKL